MKDWEVTTKMEAPCDEDSIPLRAIDRALARQMRARAQMEVLHRDGDGRLVAATDVLVVVEKVA